MIRLFKSRNKKGQALIEFALLTPLLLLMIFVFLQLGILLNIYISLNNIARDGARYAAVNPDTDSVITTYIQSKLPAQVNQSYLTISYSPSQGSSSRIKGKPISVGLSYNFSTKVFLPTTFFKFQVPTSFPTVTASMMIE